MNLGLFFVLVKHKTVRPSVYLTTETSENQHLNLPNIFWVDFNRKFAKISMKFGIFVFR